MPATSATIAPSLTQSILSEFLSKLLCHNVHWLLASDVTLVLLKRMGARKRKHLKRKKTGKS